jgi:hypothetical protein
MLKIISRGLSPKGVIFYPDKPQSSKRKNILSSSSFQKLKKKLSNITIIVIRLCPSNSNKLLNSKPCCQCIETMKCMGIKNICYSTGNNTEPIKIEKIKDIKSNHKSQMCKYLEREKIK